MAWEVKVEMLSLVMKAPTDTVWMDREIES